MIKKDIVVIKSVFYTDKYNFDILAKPSLSMQINRDSENTFKN